MIWSWEKWYNGWKVLIEGKMKMKVFYDSFQSINEMKKSNNEMK